MARVLVIDDDAGLLQMVKLMLEREGHTAILAEGGEAGLEAAQTQSPDVAIVDLMMPGISGYDVTRQLRANPNTARVPVLILTARSQPMDRQMALNAGATSFMSKPVSSRELTSRIAEILSGKIAAPSAPPSSSGIRTPEPPPPVYSNPAPQDAPPPPVGRRLPIGADASGTPAAPNAPIRKAKRQLPLTVVFSLRPGSGGTTIAVNLTFLLRKLVERVCLADFAMGNGQVGVHLHMQMRATWADLLPLGERFDTRAVGAAITAHQQAGVGVIGAPAAPPPRSLSAEATMSLLTTLANGFQQMVIDAGTINPATVAAMGVARAVVIVASDDMATAQGNFNVPQVLTNYGVDMRNVRIVVNHAHPEPGVPLQAISKALGAPINGEIPFDVNQNQALRRGIPAAIMAPESPFALSLQQLIRSF
jgi:CheY-like chemotaxis protein